MQQRVSHRDVCTLAGKVRSRDKVCPGSAALCPASLADLLFQKRTWKGATKCQSSSNLARPAGSPNSCQLTPRGKNPRATQAKPSLTWWEFSMAGPGVASERRKTQRAERRASKAGDVREQEEKTLQKVQVALGPPPGRVTSWRCLLRPKASSELAGWAGEVPVLPGHPPAHSPILALKPFLQLSRTGLLPSHPSQTHKPGRSHVLGRKEKRKLVGSCCSQASYCHAVARARSRGGAAFSNPARDQCTVHPRRIYWLSL